MFNGKNDVFRVSVFPSFIFLSDLFSHRFSFARPDLRLYPFQIHLVRNTHVVARNYGIRY